MNLEEMMLNEISQTQGANTARSHLYEVYKMVTLIETKNRMVDDRVGRGGERGRVINGYKTVVIQDG